MRVGLNKSIILWAASVLQPASASEVRYFIKNIYPEISILPPVKEIEDQFSKWRKEGCLIRVHGKSRLYSAGYDVNLRLPLKLRRHRDKARLYLLKSVRSSRIFSSGEESKELVGDSPTVEGSRSLQDSTRPIKLAAAPRGPRIIGQFYWPRISKQLKFKVGPKGTSPDIFLKFYSFPSIEVIHKISPNPAPQNDLSITDLSLAIGISPRLITSFLHASKNYYRQFTIGKRGGGERVISAPRLFLKVVQYWLLDYLLFPLRCHENCNSYQYGKSIITNALPHINSRYVANIDISDFFGSITPKMVFDLLRKNNFGEQISKTISRLVTLDNSLPQGAPTSPLISNAVLFEFDELITKHAKNNNLIYTRYADDITISGENKKAIINSLATISEELSKSGLKINTKKTRIASRGGQQKVTGVVVNVKAQPPRSLRRRIRAMFHQAEKSPQKWVPEIQRLRGYLNYFRSFTVLRGRDELKRYTSTIEKLMKLSA